ncbi:alpha-L RNA-binding motif-containing protein [Agrocybe pediades]|nr:alpha-L RNA-binding motif-containing protein [Agrocybe pediades]
MRGVNPLNMRKGLPCMSWSPKNLYNLWRRTVGPEAADLSFKNTSEETLFQQRWRSKAAVRAYHGEYIPEKVFKRWYLPDTIPDVRPRRQVFGDDKNQLEEYALRKTKAREQERKLEEEIEQKGLAPVGSLMFIEVERRLDVFLFRCCFVHSVYEARRLIIHGYVKINGRKHSKANTRLAPGDLVSVDPNALRFLRPPNNNVEIDQIFPKVDKPKKTDAAASESEQAEETEAESPKPEEDTEVVVTTKKSRFQDLTHFHLPTYAAPWLYIPAYIEVSFLTCSAVYVRHPTARPGYSEIPTPYDADGAVIRYAWEWYVKRRPRMRSQSQLARMPEDRVISRRKLQRLNPPFELRQAMYQSSNLSWRNGALPTGRKGGSSILKAIKANGVQEARL